MQFTGDTPCLGSLACIAGQSLTRFCTILHDVSVFSTSYHILFSCLGYLVSVGTPTISQGAGSSVCNFCTCMGCLF